MIRRFKHWLFRKLIGMELEKLGEIRNGNVIRVTGEYPEDYPEEFHNALSERGYRDVFVVFTPTDVTIVNKEGTGS